MENASKALIIAGEILIAVLVLTLMVSVFVAFGNFSANMHKRLSNEQIIQFNENFYQYDGRINITAQEIVTIINFAKQSNDARELDYDNRKNSPYYTTVLIDNIDFFGNSKYVDSKDDYDKNLPQILKSFLNGNNTLYFSCNVKKNSIKLLNIDDIESPATYRYMYLNKESKVRYVPEDNRDIETDGGTGLVTKIRFYPVKEFTVIDKDK